jgi:hypothetical protein
VFISVDDPSLSDLTDAMRAKLRALASRAHLDPSVVAREAQVHDAPPSAPVMLPTSVASQALLEAASRGVDLSF